MVGIKMIHNLFLTTSIAQRHIKHGWHSNKIHYDDEFVIVKQFLGNIDRSESISSKHLYLADGLYVQST
jgi:hypothetical protein